MNIIELKNSKNFLEIFLDNISTIFIILNSNGVIVETNKAFLETFSMNKEDIVGKKFSDLMKCKYEDEDKCLINGEIDEKKVVSYEIDIDKKNIEKHFSLRVKDVDFQNEIMKLIILEDLTELIEKKDELKKLATIDDLTNIYNRRYILKKLEAEMKRAKRYNHPLSIVLIDIDDFKNINDNYGHLLGDYILIETSKIMKNHIRETDYIGRLSGEEFLIILPETKIENAFMCGERIRLVIKDLELEGYNQMLSISGGLVAYDYEDSLKEFVNKAERLLYKAKNNGKNIIEI